jgi:hypothetical protein
MKKENTVTQPKVKVVKQEKEFIGLTKSTLKVKKIINRVVK